MVYITVKIAIILQRHFKHLLHWTNANFWKSDVYSSYFFHSRIRCLLVISASFAQGERVIILLIESVFLELEIMSFVIRPSITQYSLIITSMSSSWQIVIGGILQDTVYSNLRWNHLHIIGSITFAIIEITNLHAARKDINT